MLNEWKLPLNIAIGLHILVLSGALYLPEIIKSKPKFAEIYTVSLINVAEPGSTPPTATPQPKQAPPPLRPVKKKIEAKKTAPIAEKPEKTAPALKKSISLKPLKKKKIQKVKPPENQARNQERERLKRKRLAEALKEEELLAEQARLAQEALRAERELLNKPQPTDPIPVKETVAAGTTATQGSAKTTPGGSSNLIESQYLAAVFNRLHQFWAPPESLQQEPDLTTVAVITINSDGTIANILFESKSGDRVFDQFVSKTLDAANPMPPIPPALKKKRFEIGLRFRPNSIQ